MSPHSNDIRHTSCIKQTDKQTKILTVLSTAISAGQTDLLQSCLLGKVLNMCGKKRELKRDCKLNFRFRALINCLFPNKFSQGSKANGRNPIMSMCVLQITLLLNNRTERFPPAQCFCLLFAQSSLRGKTKISHKGSLFTPLKSRKVSGLKLY